MSTKITKEQFDALPDSLKGNFKAEGDDYILKTEDVSGLKSALDKERKDREAAEKLAKKFEGLDADEIKKLLADKKKFEEEEAKKAGDFDKIMQAKEAEWTQKFNAEKERADKLESDTLKGEVDTVLVTALSANGVIPERLEAAKTLMRGAVEAERRDGKTVIKFKDKSGYAQEMKPEDFGAQWRETNDYFFQSEGKGGSGDFNGKGDFAGQFVNKNDQSALSNNIEAIAEGKVSVK